MSTNQEISTINEKNENIVSEDESSKKSNVINFLIFLGCIVIAFAIWCYANFTVDPMIEKELIVQFVLEDGATNEYLTPVYHSFTFYGPKSAFANIKDNTIKFIVKRSIFKNYDEPITVKLNYGDDYHSHTTEVELTLKEIIANNNDSNTDK